HVPFARDRADDWGLIASPANVALLIPMAVLVQSAHVGFVYFDNSHQLPELRIVHRSAQPMAHVESGLIGTGINHPMNLKRADSLLAREHQEQHPEPSAERILRILEDRSRDEREAIGVPSGAFGVPALPLPWLSDFVNVFAPVAARAFHVIGPAVRK